MQDFPLYFELGWQHILDWRGYDHILFVMVLCGSYAITEWKKVLILVTAFTLGHSVTLALSVFEVVAVKSALVEFLIPVTIMMTALSNILIKRMPKKGVNFKYLLALFFGLVHGMGFSNYLKGLLGNSSSVVAELFAFNVGLEFGQLLIVAATIVLSYLLINLFRVKKWDWNLFLSAAIFGISLIMAAERVGGAF